MLFRSEAGKQFAAAYVVLAALLAVIHWTLLHQPPLRGALYGLFWAVPAAGVITLASQNERRKRRERGDV